MKFIRIISISIFLCWLSGVASSFAFAENERVALKVAVPGNYPLSYLKDGAIEGIIGRTAALILQSMNYEVVPVAVPFKRMYRSLEAGDVDVATSVLATPKRLETAYFSDPIIIEYTVLVKHVKSLDVVQTLNDLPKYEVQGILGFAYPRLDKRAINIKRAWNYEKALNLAAARKTDFALVGSITGRYLINKLGLTSHLAYNKDALNAVPLGVAFSKNNFGSGIAETFNEHLELLKNSQQWGSILDNLGLNPKVVQTVYPIMPD